MTETQHSTIVLQIFILQLHLLISVLPHVFCRRITSAYFQLQKPFKYQKYSAFSAHDGKLSTFSKYFMLFEIFSFLNSFFNMEEPSNPLLPTPCAKCYSFHILSATETIQILKCLAPSGHVCYDFSCL